MGGGGTPIEYVLDGAPYEELFGGNPSAAYCPLVYDLEYKEAGEFVPYTGSAVSKTDG